MEHLVAVAMYVQTHWIGVLLAVIVSFIIGALWHGVIFAKPWAKLAGMEHMKKEEAMKSMPYGMAASILMAFVQAAVLGRAFQILLLPNVGYAVIIALILWIPFTGLPMLNNYVWSHKPMKLLAIDAGYNLVSLVAIAKVLYFTM